MKQPKILITYSLLVCLFLTLVGIFTAKKTADLLSSFIFVPLVFYFGTKLLFSPKKSSKSAKSHKPVSSDTLTVTVSQPSIVAAKPLPGVADNDKRLFLKLIGTTSLALLFMSLFTKKAQASFFGSAPVGPGIVGLKDAAGKKINPAEKGPTDGYAITNIDDADSPVYYGFVNSAGAWYIMSQDSLGEYLYAKGDSDFATSWTNRSHLFFDYFNTVFG